MRVWRLCFALAIVLALLGGLSIVHSQVAVQALLLSTKSVPPGPTIQTVTLSNNTFTANVANSTVGTVSVTMSDASAFTGSLQVTGTNSGGFHLAGNVLQTNSAGTTGIGPYSDVTILATQGSSSNSISPTLTGSTVSASCTNPTIPTTASAAGFTQVLYYADFSCPAYATTTSASKGYLNKANGWFGTDNTAHEFIQTHVYSDAIGAVHVSSGDFIAGATDPVTGAKVLDIHWNSANCPNLSGGPCVSDAGKNNGGNTTVMFAEQNFNANSGGTPTIVLPTNVYIAFKFRAGAVAAGSQGAYDSMSMSAYWWDVNNLDAGFNAYEGDPFLWEIHLSETYRGFYARWSNGSCTWGCDAIDGQTGPPPDFIAAPHTAAVLLRASATNGDGTACFYADDAALDSSNCKNLNPTDNQAHHYRTIVGLNNGAQRNSSDFYVYNILILTRSGCDAVNTECLGPTN